MKRRLTVSEINKALRSGGLEIIILRDYVPSSRADEAAYQEIDFHERVWRSLLLTATGRDKVSRQLFERQCALQRKRGTSAALRVNVLTLDAARKLQKAGYTLEVASPQTRLAIPEAAI
jgi:hypothetical protein